MAGANKKSRPAADPDSGDGNESDESGEYHGQQEILATFEGRNPEAQDFHGIKQLLHQLFPASHIDLGQMSDMIISQVGIGAVLKQSCNDSDDEEDADMVEESDVFGITTIINISSHKESPCVQQLCQHILEENAKQPNPAIKAGFEEILTGSQRIALLLNERFVNIPCKISGLLLGSLFDELERMKRKKQDYNLDYILMVCKLWKPKSKTGEIQFSNDEEELFANKADYSFEFSVAGKSDTGLTGQWQSEDHELIPFRRVLLFKADKLESIVNEVKVFVA